MNSTIVVALVSAGASLLVCLINNHYQRADVEAKHKESITLISYRLEQLEKKMDLHNSVVQRTYELEKRADVTDEQIKVINHRIEDLEKFGDDRK